MNDSAVATHSGDPVADAASEHIPGLKFTSCHVLHNASSAVRNSSSSGGGASTIIDSGAFDCGALLNPFHCYEEGDTQNVAAKSPIICLTCAGYLSPYVHINSNTGQWRCPFCRSVNPSFYSGPATAQQTEQLESILRDSCPELRSKHFDYEEEIATVLPSSGSSYLQQLHQERISSQKHFIFGIDSTICADADAMASLQRGLRQLSGDALVSFFIFDRNLHLLRLGSAVGGQSTASAALDAYYACDGDAAHGELCTPVQVDLLPGNCDKYAAATLLLRLIRRGYYNITARAAATNWDSILKAMHSVVLMLHPADGDSLQWEDIGSRAGPCTTFVDTLVGLSVALANPQQQFDEAGSNNNSASALRPARLLLLTGRSIPIANPLTVAALPGMLQNASCKGIDAYNTLGKWALNAGCWIDVFCASIRETNADCLDGLTAPSGGSIVTMQTFSKFHGQKSLDMLLQFYAQESSCSATVMTDDGECMATLEVRTCGRLAIERLVGPIVPAEDVVQQQRTSTKGTAQETGLQTKTGRSAAELAIDVSHLSHTMYFAQRSAHAFPQQQTNAADEKSISNATQDKVLESIIAYNQEHTLITGITSPRCVRGSLITTQFKSSEPRYVEQSNAIEELTQSLLGLSTASKSSSPVTSAATSAAAVSLIAAGQKQMQQQQQQHHRPFSAKRVSNSLSPNSSYNTINPAAITPAAIDSDIPLEGRNSTTGLLDSNYSHTSHVVEEASTRLESAYVQFVVRFQRNAPSPMPAKLNNGQQRNQQWKKYKVTRVWTQRMDVTDDVDEYLAFMDAELWSLVTARGIVADYHSDCIDRFGGARKRVLDEEGKDTFAAVRGVALHAVDAMVQSITCHWNCFSSPVNREKLIAACRSLYHLREGPLLDGPAVQPLDAYLLRAQFLKTYFGQAKRLLIPSVVTALVAVRNCNESIVTKTDAGNNGPPKSTASGSQDKLVDNSSAKRLQPLVAVGDSDVRFIQLPADSLSLLPGSVSIIDTGDAIVVRVGVSLSVNKNVAVDHSFTAPSVAAPASSVLSPTTHAAGILFNKLQSGGDDSDRSVDDTEQQLQQWVADCAVEFARRRAATRYPVCPVFVLTAPGTPQDRLAYSRLSPSHMDHRELLKQKVAMLYERVLQVHSDVLGLLSQEEIRTLSAALLDDELIDRLVAYSPFTDQPFFGKYLRQVAPRHVSDDLLGAQQNLQRARVIAADAAVTRLLPTTKSQRMERDAIHAFSEAGSSEDKDVESSERLPPHALVGLSNDTAAAVTAPTSIVSQAVAGVSSFSKAVIDIAAPLPTRNQAAPEVEKFAESAGEFL